MYIKKESFIFVKKKEFKVIYIPIFLLFPRFGTIHK